MKITIDQKSISFGSQYQIFINNKENYYAETDAFTRSIIHFYEKAGLRETHTIFKSLYLFRPTYKIELPDGRRIKFESKSLWGNYFRCVAGTNVYELYFHPKRKISIFENGIQIGFGQQNAVTILAGDKYDLILDDQIDNNLIICFFLILDNLNSRNFGNLFTINDAPVFNESKKFDSSWNQR